MTTRIAKTGHPCASSSPEDFRRLETRRGDFFVRWAPDHVSALLCCLALRPDDIAPDDPQRRHRLVKDLFLLGLRDELARGGPSIITRFARALMRGAAQPGPTLAPGGPSWPMASGHTLNAPSAIS